ncbi:MAG: DUF1080 domain-containing protein, partial [Gemmatimonadaceae bacterium]
MKASIGVAVLLLGGVAASATAQGTKPRPEDTEVWKPVPAVVRPGRTDLDAPSDAVVLFDGKDESSGYRPRTTRRHSGTCTT